MSMVISSFTVLFSEPFWIGIFERTNGKKYEVSKIVFGSEPKDCEIYDTLLKNYHKLKFSPPMSADKQSKSHINPKRMQRLVHKKVEQKYIGTKAQQALKLQHEKNKTERKSKSKDAKEQEIQRQFEIRQRKKLEKHKGH